MEGTQVFIHYTRKHRPDQLKKTTAFCFVMKHEWLALKVIREACGRAGCVKAAFLHCELQLEPEGHQSCVCASCAGTQIQPFPRFALLLKVNTIDLVAATVGLAAQHLGASQTLWRGGRKASRHVFSSLWLSSAPERALCLRSDAEHLMGLVVA